MARREEDLIFRHREDKATLLEKLREQRLRNIQQAMAHDFEFQQLRLREMEKEQALMLQQRFVRKRSEE